MKWEDFRPDAMPPEYESTEIECPVCGHYLMRYIRIVLTAYPAKYRYDCPNCKWSGTK